jgi:hypothetical protein
MRVSRFKRLLLVGWSLWWTCVLIGNLADAAKDLGLLPASRPFASGNYQLVTETTARFGVPPVVNAALFAGVLAWEALATGLFWRAAWRHGSPSARPALYAAFTAGLLLWLAFMIADELCCAYAVEATHVRLFMAQIATLIAVDLLPETGP